MRELVGVADAGFVEVQTQDAAADFFGEVQGVAAGTAANFQDIRIALEGEQFGNFGGLLRGDPACLAEVFAVGFDADFAVGIRFIISVGVVVKIELG